MSWVCMCISLLEAQVYKNSKFFKSVKTEGELLPQEILQRIITGDENIPYLSPLSYHLSANERLNEEATRAWNRLTGVWKSFKSHIEQLSPEAIGTSETREKWLLILFQELGYGRLQVQKAVEIDGKSFQVSHVAKEPVAIHLVSCKWDIDKRNSTSKNETKLSPHSLMQEYLNKCDEHLWGIVTNGYRLRILRDNLSLTRISYVEFDLQSIMDNENYSDFFLFWLICHQSRFETILDENGKQLPPQTCIIEKWYGISVDEGVRALDELRSNVQKAIEFIGSGYLSHKLNSSLKEKLKSGELTQSEFYHQVLRQIYRLLFVFVAEDRDLLFPENIEQQKKSIYLNYYSTLRVRGLAQRKRGSKHHDLWEQLKLLFTLLYNGNDQLGLSALGSMLFSPEAAPDLNTCCISNSDLLSALKSLCYTGKNKLLQQVSYKNLGPEELGSVYESLLEMHPTLHLETATFELKIISGSERKTTGSYYTPSSLVNCLIDSALEPVIENKLASATHSQESALLTLKICDPACGSGHFLIAAAHRIAKRLAAVRVGEDEPAPSIVQHALRDVIGHCIYGVDINPMSVELCKISLWMEALEPGKPLTFLDHHIQCGNSLLGCTPELLKKGIPDGAFDVLTGDDKDDCQKYKRQNKIEINQQMDDLFGFSYNPWEHLGRISEAQLEIENIDDNNIENLKKKELLYKEHLYSNGYFFNKFIYDAWCSAFVWSKNESSELPFPITSQTIFDIEKNPHTCYPWMRDEIIRLANVYQFLHWHIAFPEIFIPNPQRTDYNEQLGWAGGFDCILGNPPWERVKLQEKEFFAVRDSDIANAVNSSVRKKMIEELPKTNPLLYDQFLEEKRKSEASSQIIRTGGFYPLCGRGDVNTYTIFAELNRTLLNSNGRCGCIVPSGIATDDTTKYFFQDIVETKSLVSFYDFENREGIFMGVHRSYKFCLITLQSPKSTSPIRNLAVSPNTADFMFFAHNISDLNNQEQHFQLSNEDIALINPNTHTCPIFRSKQDAEVTKYIYHMVPVLINENDEINGNPWGISFMRMFDMSNDSKLFKTKDSLESMGFILEGNHFIKCEERYLPLYEGKMVQNYDHRAADIRISEDALQRKGQPEVISYHDHLNPHRFAIPNNWVAYCECEKAMDNTQSLNWMLGFSNITSPTNARTFIPCMIPASAVGHSFQLILNQESNAVKIVCLYGIMSSYVFDFNVRQKIGGVNLSYFLVKQFPVFPAILNEVVIKILELSYTAYDMSLLAQDCGYDGPPFIWNEERRFEIRCELDALYFHLYLSGGVGCNWCELKGDDLTELKKYFPTPRHAVEYIMETFPIVKKNDEKQYGEYRTKRRILEIYDKMLQCQQTGIEYKSNLNPPPGPPCDEKGDFIPVNQWDLNNWPENVHVNKSLIKKALEDFLGDGDIYPATDTEKALCAAFLAVVEQKQQINDQDCLESLLLAAHPNYCMQLLNQSDLTNYEKIKQKTTTALFIKDDHLINWSQIRSYLEKSEAISVYRGKADFVITKGVKFEFVQSRFPNVNNVMVYALKAQDKLKQIKLLNEAQYDSLIKKMGNCYYREVNIA